jgi:energy-coupling factor transport system ATP-binding protein
VLIVSHSMEDIARLADRILVMNDGKVFCCAEPPAVFSRSTELEQIGLSVPQVTRVFNALNELGFGLPQDVYTVKYAEKVLRERLEQES